jgi:N-acetylglucosamine malate deacetylase 2
MTTSMPVIAPVTPVGGPLPLAGSVLAVTARPGRESVDLGGLLYAFRRTGATLGLLCLTRGEASPLNSTCARLEAVRPWELQLAASILGISSVAVANYPDSGLRRQPMAELTERVQRAIRQQSADLLLVIDPAAGDPDDTAVAVAACTAARQAGVPTVACTSPATPGSWTIDLGAETATARAIQKSATAAHTSQSQALPQLARQLDRLGGREQLRWLVSPQRDPRARSRAVRDQWS